MPTLCLNMIVRDESAIISKCLESVKPYIDHWVIADTGSTDDTRQIIQDTLSDIPGKLVELPFSDFAATRNTALELAKAKSDYVLLMDADMQLVTEKEDFRNTLEKDGYHLELAHQIRSFQIRIIRSSLTWMYYGMTDEFLLSSDATTIEIFKGIKVVHHRNGKNRKQVQEAAVPLLEQILAEYPEDSHALFHLANRKYRSGDFEQAQSLYIRFLALEQHWDEEWVWFARYQLGRIHERLGSSGEDIVTAYLDAYRTRPVRAEPLYQICRYLRESGDLELADIYGNKAVQLEIPKDLYDLDLHVYRWLLPVEYSLVNFKRNNHVGTVIYANKALKHRAISKNIYNSVINSRQRSLDLIYENRKKANPDNIQNRIRIVVPFRNAASFLAPCINSIRLQDYSNFSVTFINDCSDDGSELLVPIEDPRFTLINNVERVGPLVNRADFILDCNEDDIVVYLDGDDQLASDDALSHTNSLYNLYDCWLTYGQFLTQNGNIGWAQPYPSLENLTQNLDHGDIVFPIHPITHRAGLLHRLKDIDPELDSFRDENGNWLFYASDAVLARPLFYLAGWDRIIYNNRATYLYTEGHEISESITNKKDQLETCKIASEKFKPAKLRCYKST